MREALEEQQQALRPNKAYALAVVGCLFLSACAPDSGSGIDAVPAAGALHTDFRIYRNPYGDVDWSNDLRLKAQHHDHVVRNPALIPAYDAAGYDVLSLMDYSGQPTAAYAFRERTWPPERWVSQSVLASLVNIKLFIPNAEQIGLDLEHHATSPFLETYIERAPSAAQLQGADGAASPAPAMTSTQYRTWNDLLAVVRAHGGLPCVAHPVTYTYAHFKGLLCAEMYTAYAEAARIDMPGTWLHTRDGNALLLANWDHALQQNQDVLGIAVNDHFGPGHASGRIPPQVLDSGKIIVLAKAATLEAYRDAFERGAFFAVRDQGIVKDRYPTIFTITADETFAWIKATGNVTWTTGGVVVSSGPVLLYSDIPPNTRYVRAEVADGDGSVVYTQAFVVRPTLDADGDYDVDVEDRAICEAVSSGLATEATRLAACRAARRAGNAAY